MCSLIHGLHHANQGKQATRAQYSHQPPPRLKLNRRRGNPKEELRNKALSNEQNKELKDTTLKEENSTRVLKRDNLQPLNNNSQSYSPTKRPMVGLLRIQAHLVQQQQQMAPPTQ